MITGSDAEILNELTQAVSRVVPTALGQGVELAPLPPARTDRRYSFMFSYRLTGSAKQSRSLLVKIPREAWMKTLQEATGSQHIREAVCEEVERLTYIAEVISRAGRPGLVALRPCALLREFNALLLEEVPLRMLKTTLSRPAIMAGAGQSWRNFETHLARAGEWLQVVHGSSSVPGEAALKDLGIEAGLESELSNLEGVLAHSLPKIRENFRLLYDSLQEEVVPQTCLHNDYQLGNIFVAASGQVGALDPNWLEAGCAYKDLATLLVDPPTRRRQVLLQGATFRHSLQKRFERAVLQGYFGGSRSVPPLLDFYCALAVLIKWHADEDFLISSASEWYAAAAWIVRPWMRAYFQRLTRSYLLRGLQSLQALRQPAD